MAICEVSDNILITCADESANAGLKDIYLCFEEQIDGEPVVDPAAHTVTAVTMLASNVFVKLEGRFEKKDLTTEMTRENGSVRSTRTLNVFTPNVEKVKGALLTELTKGKKLFMIATDYNSTGTYKKGLVLGYDPKLGKKDSGAMMVASEVIEATVEGVAGYNLVFTAVATELLREYIGTILVEDGATGETVNIGS